MGEHRGCQYSGFGIPPPIGGGGAMPFIRAISCGNLIFLWRLGTGIVAFYLQCSLSHLLFGLGDVRVFHFAAFISSFHFIPRQVI